MHCVLVAATAQEVEPFVNHYYQTNKQLYIDFTLHIIITGVGMVATTYHLTKYLALHKPDVVIQLGIAGSYTPSLPLCTVVAVKADCFADVGVVEQTGWADAFDLKLTKKNAFPYTQKKLKNPHTMLLKRSQLALVQAATVNQISTSKKVIAAIVHHYNPTIETMEGAALHYVCLQYGVPYIQLRGVSNYVGVRNKQKWNTAGAIAASNKVLITLFESL